MRICIVGAGPRGTGVLQRLCALGTDLEVHVVDPYPPGPGRIWRRAQPDLLWMNSPVSGVDMFGGPDGLPSLWDWFRGEGTHLLAGGELAGEASRLTERRFASRPLAGTYYEWIFAQASAKVRVHRCQAVDVRDHGSGQAVWLEGATEPLIVDAVILTQGHVGTRPVGGTTVLPVENPNTTAPVVATEAPAQGPNRTTTKAPAQPKKTDSAAAAERERKRKAALDALNQ